MISEYNLLKGEVELFIQKISKALGKDKEIENLRREESFEIPTDIDYFSIPSLSMELRQKLARVKPETLGQAQRIDGMTPAGLACLLGAIKKPSARQVA